MHPERVFLILLLLLPTLFSPMVFATFLLSDLVQTFHTSSAHHYLGSFFLFLDFPNIFSKKLKIFRFRYLLAVALIRLKFYTYLLLLNMQGLFFLIFSNKNLENLGLFFYSFGHFSFAFCYLYSHSICFNFPPIF